MYAKMYGVAFPLRAFRAAKSFNCLSVSPNFSQCYVHHLSCVPQRNVDFIRNLHPQPEVSAFLTSKRFRTNASHLSKEPSNISNITSVLAKPRTPRRRNKSLAQREEGYPVIAFSTADEYNLEGLVAAIAKQELYSVVDKGFEVQECEHKGEDVVHIKANYNVEQEPREVFFFREGTAVFWNVSELEISNLLRFIIPFEISRYHEKLVLSEKEYMSYVHGERTFLRNDVFELANACANSLEKYTFSNGIALSVKLGIWEASLEKYIQSIEYITEDLKAGRKIRMTREEVLRKQGELFALRHSINLSSDLLDIPDFYWDNQDLEKIYLQTTNYFSISRRTRVMNEKISHCAGLVELISSHLSDKHHVRLEWMIIALIMVEVGFEFLHFVGK